jgi:chromosome segregation ATPase
MSTELEQLRARITELAGECARLAKREADLMFDCGAERARAEAAEALVGELREQIAEDVGVKTVNQMLRQQLTEAENQALGGQDLVDSLRARVAELEAELGDSRLSGSLIAKECGEAQARVAELEQAERVAHYERNDAKQSLGIALDDLAERDAELARLREMHLGQFTNLEQAMEERDVLRARVAELEAELGDSRLSGSLIAKECGEAQARVAQLERDKARLIEAGDLLVASESLEVGWHEAVAAWQSAKEDGK